jgi:hypothetical protein
LTLWDFFQFTLGMVRNAKNNLTTTDDCFYYHFRAYLRKLNMLKIKDLEVEIVLGIHDLFGPELAMIFSLHVGLTVLVMQGMHFFFCLCLFDIFLPPHCQIYYFNIRKKVNNLLSV